VAQEAIANVIQHADAHHVGIVLALEGDWLTLEVRDDGVGFDTRLQDQPSDRLGILGMRERLALVHGELAIESQPGCCTRLIARAPVPQPIIGGQDGQDSGTAR
jgi:signal transduction histidine kinase